MKIDKYIIAAIAIFSISLQSCSLEEDTSSISTPDNFFRKYSECQSVVNGCYIPLKSIYTYTYLIATECCTDIAYCNSGTLDARLDISPAIPRFGATAWTQGYLGVQRCNFAIQGIEKSTALTDTERKQLLCEAKDLRAFYFYTLTSFFGDVPFYFDDVANNEVMDSIAILPRMSAVDTRNKCIADLKTIVDKVPQTRTSENSGDRLGAACGWMLIAKMDMWNAYKDPSNKQKYLNDALIAISKIKDIYGSDLSAYDLETNFLFRNKNPEESIMDIQHWYEEGGLSYVSNAAAICTPTIKKIYDVDGVTVIGATYDGVEIPELGYETTTWSAMRPNVYFCQGLQTKNGSDLRRNVNMAWEYNGKKFESVDQRPWPGPKFWCPMMKATSDGNNYRVFRFADALLLEAEALCELDRDADAVIALNITRNRAGLGDYVYRTHVRLQEEIRCERARELWGEFQRKFDLVRWGIWYDATLENSDYQALKDNIKPCHEYYPIPDKEVTYSKNHLDNKEYEKYGL